MRVREYVHMCLGVPDLESRPVMTCYVLGILDITQPESVAWRGVAWSYVRRYLWFSLVIQG